MTKTQARVKNAIKPTTKTVKAQVSAVNVGTPAANSSSFIAGNYVADAKAQALQTQKLNVDFGNMQAQAKVVARRHTTTKHGHYKLMVEMVLFGKTAVDVDGYMDTICPSTNGKKFKKNVSHGINFAPLITAVWAGLDCELVNNKTNRISRAMNKILEEYNANPDKYATGTVKKLVDFIVASGGESGLVSYKAKGAADVNGIMSDIEADLLLCQSATKLSEQERADVKEAALAHYKNVTVLPTAKFARNVLVNEDGCSLVLVNKKKNGEYAVLSQVTDTKLINKVIAEEYGADISASPKSLRVINEVLMTQCLPSSMQHTYKKLTEEAGKFSDGSSRKVVRRLVHKAAEGTFLMSAIRADSSLVTIATPKSAVVESVAYDVQLLALSRRQLEQTMISPRQFNAYKLENLKHTAVFPCGGLFSHHLRLVPAVVTEKAEVKAIDVDLAPESSQNESIYQVDIADMAKAVPLWERKVGADWVKVFNSQFTNNWVKSHGQNITRPNQTVLELEFKGKVIQVNFFKKGMEYETGLTVTVNVPMGKQYGAPCHVLSKDFTTAMHGIGDLPLIGGVTLRVYEGFLQVMYETDAATYQVYIPFATEGGVRNAEGYSTYQLVRADIDPEDDPCYQSEEDMLQ